MLLREIPRERDMRAASMCFLAAVMSPLGWGLLFLVLALAESDSSTGILIVCLCTISLIPGICAWSLWRFHSFGRWCAIRFVVLVGIANTWCLNWFWSLSQFLESLGENPLLSAPFAMGIPCLGGVLWALLRPGAGRVCSEEYRATFSRELGRSTRWWTSWIFWAGCPVIGLLANVFVMCGLRVMGGC